MSPVPRLKRVRPERSGPIRNPTPRPGNVLEAAAGAVECGVHTAYAVIDEYMRRGREAAGRYQERSDWRGDMRDNRCNPNYNYNYNYGFGTWGPMWPFVAPWMNAMRAWTEAMTGTVPGAAPRDPYWDSCTDTTAPRVSVHVSSESPVEVIPRFEGCVDAVKLQADQLKADDGSGALPVDAVGITTSPGHITVKVKVPKDQWPGCYRAAIKDGAGCKVGDLTVKVFAAEKP